jgi:hypothetical protein
MKKDIESDYKYVEPQETSEEKILNFIIDGFDNLLEKIDKDYKEKIFFNVSYNLQGDHYKVNILPCADRFNSQRYFKKKFEGKKSLAKFADENNIGLITY